MTPNPIVAANEARNYLLLKQRDQAVVCAVLMAALTLVACWSNFGREYPGLKETVQAVRQHRELLGEHQKLEAEVNEALMAARQELERIQPTGQGSR